MFVAVAIFSGSCGHAYQRPLTPATDLDTSKSYVYGRFKLADGLGAWRLAIQLRTVSSDREINLRLLPTDDVYAIEIDPEAYRVCCLLLADISPPWWYGYSNTAPLPPPLGGHEFRVEPGKAYYLGDFVGSIHGRVVDFGMYFKFEGGLSQIEDEFERTSDELRRRYPDFEKVKLERLP